MISSFTKNCKHLLILSGLTLIVLLSGFNGSYNDKKSSSYGTVDTSGWPESFGLGRTATASEIAAIDIDVSPSGKGLPAGSGNSGIGRRIYDLKCAFCHGPNGTEGPFNILVGAMNDTAKAKTIGNYWPYSTTLFDYMRRAMPLNLPGSLSNNDVYSLTAYLLYKNKIIDSATVMNAITLPKVKMPAQSFFVPDDRRGGPEIR